MHISTNTPTSSAAASQPVERTDVSVDGREQGTDDAQGVALPDAKRPEEDTFEPSTTPGDEEQSEVDAEEVRRGEVHDLMLQLKRLSSESASGKHNNTEKMALQAQANAIVDSLKSTGEVAPVVGTNLLDGASATPTPGVDPSVPKSQDDSLAVTDAPATTEADEVVAEAEAIEQAAEEAARATAARVTAEVNSPDAAARVATEASTHILSDPLVALAAHTARVPDSVLALLR